MKLLAIAIGAGLLLHPSPDPQPFRWTGALPAGQSVEIKGVGGSIRVVGVPGDRIEVTATRRRGHAGSPEDVELRVIRHDEGVTICAVYPSGRLAVAPHIVLPPNDCTPGHWEHLNVAGNDTQVDFEVRLPARNGIVAYNMEGDITVSGAAESVVASSVTGDVILDGIEADAVSAGTIQGRVSYRGVLRPNGWYRFDSLSGMLDVGIPAGCPATLSLEGRPRALQADLDPAPRWLTATGAGRHTAQLGPAERAARVDLKTMDGRVKLTGTRFTC
jgi:hypothetical protein